MARLLQTLSSCRTEYFGRLGMVKVSFGSKADLEEMSASGANRPFGISRCWLPCVKADFSAIR